MAVILHFFAVFIASLLSFFAILWYRLQTRASASPVWLELSMEATILVTFSLLYAYLFSRLLLKTYRRRVWIVGAVVSVGVVGLMYVFMAMIAL